MGLTEYAINVKDFDCSWLLEAELDETACAENRMESKLERF